MTLSYHAFNRHYLIVYCDKNKCIDYMEPLGGKWHSDDDESGFLIPREKETQLVKLIEFINMKESGLSRKEQHKYHRSISESEDSEEDVDEDESKNDKKILKKTPHSKKKYDKSDPKEYYKSFNAKPADFAKLNKTGSYSDLEEYSSSSRGSSSSDNFPEPNSPRPRQQHHIDELYETVNELKYRIRQLENKCR